MSASPRVNQYEKGKHAPDFQMAKRLAAVLNNVPAAYFYTEDDDLANVLLVLGSLPLERRKRLIEVLRKMVAEDL